MAFSLSAFLRGREELSLNGRGLVGAFLLRTRPEAGKVRTTVAHPCLYVPDPFLGFSDSAIREDLNCCEHGCYRDMLPTDLENDIAAIKRVPLSW